LEHNQSVVDYFRHRPVGFLILNLSAPDLMERRWAFLGQPWDWQQTPQLNQSA
jgi:hypothetical protein